jgi:alpha-D-xyloside xylohydrolase
MDFPADPAVRDIPDQYLFGRALLVAPVTRFKARSRPVYLPAGASWYDFHSGRAFAGGRTIQADAPAERMPLFVRAGAIVPLGPEIQYVGEKPGAPLTLVVYGGANGEFSFYEDDGTSLGYQKGAFSRIPLSWDERSGVLTIGAREGRWPGMAERRLFNVRLVSAAKPSALDSDRKPDASVTYDGAQKQLKLR